MLWLVYMHDARGQSAYIRVIARKGVIIYLYLGATGPFDVSNMFPRQLEPKTS